MKNELKYGKIRFISFVVLDLLCMIASNALAFRIYIDYFHVNYSYQDHLGVVIAMLIIDVFVTAFFNTLCRVLRRGIRKEARQSLKHVVLSFVLLAVLLFTTRSGSEFSRVIISLAYIIDYFLLVVMHVVWKTILQEAGKESFKHTALLMSTDGFVEEGLEDLKKANVDVKSILLLLNLHHDTISGIPVVNSVEEAVALVCWENIDRVYIYGLDHTAVPAGLHRACQEMGIKIDNVDFKFRVLEVKSVEAEDAKYGRLSFLEQKRDIPFHIRRVYWITETEASLHRGFHAHKQNCQLIFCPYGKIDMILDDGKEKTTICLDKPEKGLLLMPGIWREMIWKQSGSVLCVLASEYYDENDYIRSYDEFMSYHPA